jgi:CRP-like cAMP-binding protein
MKVSRDVYDRHVRTYSAGETIFRENAPGKEMFVIIEGRVEISKSTAGGSSKTLIELAKGDIFGEMALVEKKTRSATARAMAPTRLLVMDEALFQKTLDGNADFARKMIRILSERLRRANTLLQNVLASNRQNQVMEALVEYAGQFGEPTSRGVRVNLDGFVEWASAHIGIDARGIRPILQGMEKRNILEPSSMNSSEAVLKGLGGSRG